MSSARLDRDRALSMGSGRSVGRNASMADFSMPQNDMPRDFEPCDATASMFLYAQGSSIVVAHHDTLKIERRFSRHTEEVRLLVVDNVSERGAGRLVLSYDVSQTAIVWDIISGDEIARFASYSDLSVAAWMRNGNVAFGNGSGSVILFEPPTSEHISARTIDSIPITSIAPAADCRTYAIGYQNGSILIASLQPRFTILHNLSTNRAPSPIITLAWHASSSRAKSDMLATQTRDGDLRVWSVGKGQNSSDPAKVVRVLKKNDNPLTGPNWLGWSKNGRIIQFADGETLSWDVRTKNVTRESIPTLDHVRGIALYGPGATLFTLGPNNTAQQFDLNSPPVLVANVQHPANLLPPSPPISIEEQKRAAASKHIDEYSSVPINIDVVSESDDEHMSPLARIAREMDQIEEHRPRPDRSGTLSPVSSQASFTSRSSTGSRNYRKPGHGSVASKGASDHTIMSVGSTLRSRAPSMASSRDSVSRSSVTSSQASGHSRRGASRLRQEVIRSPEDQVVVELFRFTKSRLSDVPYTNPQVMDGTGRTVTELRLQMLSTIFGFNGEAGDLIRDELQRHPQGSTNRLLLTKWLGDVDMDIMATSSESMTSSDWMLLALSGIGGQASQQKIARAYVQRLLEKGDVHTAATIMIGMGDQNDAIEIYVSHRRYMEALILACYVYPADWGRQTQLLRKWGEWAVQHSQHQLAIRCFSCTTTDVEPYFSPPAQIVSFSQLTTPGIPELLSPPLSPPGVVPRGPQRNMAKTAALKLVTSFGNKNEKSKFFGADGDKTPMNGMGVTPIAESALSPGGNAQTAFLRPSQRSVMNTPASATRTATPGGYGRARLPSIGEMPTDVTPILVAAQAAQAEGWEDDDTSSEISVGTNGRPKKSHGRQKSGTNVPHPPNLVVDPVTRASTASPMMEKTLKPGGGLPAPSPAMFTLRKQESRLRNGSRDRKPDGLQIQWPPMESILTGDYMTTPELSATSSMNDQTPIARSVAASVAGSISSVSLSGRSHRSQSVSQSVASPLLTGSSLDPYISSLESAKHEKQRSRARSTSRKPYTREPSEDRGRSASRHVKPAKGSPTSPIPMSPDDIRDVGGFHYDDDRSETASVRSDVRKAKLRDASQTTARPGSKAASRIRQRSPDASQPPSRPASRTTRIASRRTSPETSSRNNRGRSKARDGSLIRSPSSPLPMSPNAAFYSRDASDFVGEEDLQPPRSDHERLRSRNRSVSRARGVSASRRTSPERKTRARSSSRHGPAREQAAARDDTRRERRADSRTKVVSDMKGDLQQIKTERQRKKEIAARELEDRRRSLVRRPSAPPIVHPAELSPPLTRSSSRNEHLRSTAYVSPDMPVRSQTVSPESMRLASSRFQETKATVQIGLPATPRAMQHPKYDPDNKDVPDVPQIPESYTPALQNLMGSLNEIPEDSAMESLILPQTTFTPLPKTTYQAAPRHIPPRSVSAPIPEGPLSPMALPSTLPTHPAFHAALPPSSRRRNDDVEYTQQSHSARKIKDGDSQPGTLGFESRNNVAVYSAAPLVLGGIDETLQANKHHINPDNNNMVPPPPPPAPLPPILPQLQHLAKPPPPPPPPLYRMVSSTSAPSLPAQGTGIIEVVTDGDEDTAVVEPPLPLEPRTHSVNHNRGRSITDNTLTGRFGRATDRLRSASRGASPQLTRTKSPPISQPLEHAPYESVPTQKWVLEQVSMRSASASASANTYHGERHPREVKADMMNHSDMI